MPKYETDPEDPLELHGVELVTAEDTTDAMTECFIEEFLRLGYDAPRLLALFRNPFYSGLHRVLHTRGEAFVRHKITEVFTRWQRPVEFPAPAAPGPPTSPHA